ncbi:lytic murein transglycosylase [Phaeobacter gallaeciensis]|uniref:lytic murein transglycosylase n=1 Tax=Phaeobacter gallaeciensis TaxID=60890 RepID=UPI000BBC369F|nr:lytic murein transglycosylase [Phaeobacter gallaeciensis]ATF16872.1 putative lytic murein transglycosylase [Phaeobacter gallaeciensis]ATF20981.1 putative lytic murein transglycosylase [Phaeobacter gallaeciensis]
MLRPSILALVSFLLPLQAHAQCGGGFRNFVQLMKEEALTGGYDSATVNRFFENVRQDPAVLKADRAQGVFQKPFIEFSRRLISKSRLDRGQAMSRKYDATFRRIETTYGIDRSVLLAFWAFETDYGAVQGNFNTLNALVTLAHDCRRPELFRPQVFAALELFRQGNFDPRRTTGAWAGEIGMVQMLPGDILENGVDADGDGHVSLKTSAPDALMSGAKMLSHLGWRPNEPWLQEVTIPADLDLNLSGVHHKETVADWQALGISPRSGRLAERDTKAALILPQGHKGPAFLAYPNFDVYFEWNQSFTYVLTAAYFATRLSGATSYDAGNPDTGLAAKQMEQLQRKLQARGHDVGDVDGILGAKTRVAVQKEQKRLGLPADAWPTPTLLSRL